MSLLVDKKVLESQYTRDNLSIHYKLITLYTKNLNSIAITCSLISSLSFGCIHEFDFPTKFLPTNWRFGDFYTLFSMCAVISSILGLSQSTICVIFGPTMFLFGDGHVDSLTALKIMKHQQNEAGFWTCVSVFMALLQSLFYTWGVTHFPLSCFLTFVHFCGYYIIYSYGRQSIQELSPSSQSSSPTITDSQQQESTKPTLYRRLSSMLGIDFESENSSKTTSTTITPITTTPSQITLSELEDLKSVS